MATLEGNSEESSQGHRNGIYGAHLFCPASILSSNSILLRAAGWPGLAHQQL